MVKLYLHCGYHKTGSSFLQTLFAQNRDYLLENNICFPFSKDDKNMLKGEISPGNGIELVKAIREKNNALIIDLLEKWVKITLSNNCDSLLISSEGLFHVLAESGYLCSVLFMIWVVNEICQWLCGVCVVVIVCVMGCVCVFITVKCVCLCVWLGVYCCV